MSLLAKRTFQEIDWKILTKDVFTKFVLELSLKQSMWWLYAFINPKYCQIQLSMLISDLYEAILLIYIFQNDKDFEIFHLSS